MGAVIRTGGKQYAVSVGDKIKVETLPVEAGGNVDFEEVLLVSNDGDVKLGSPYVAGAKVSGKVLSHGRGKKIEIIKFKRRKHHMKRQGHRQNYTEVEITNIA